MVEQAKRVPKFASDEEFEAWLNADIRAVSEGAEGRESEALAEATRLRYDLAEIKDSYRLAREAFGQRPLKKFCPEPQPEAETVKEVLAEIVARPPPSTEEILRAGEEQRESVRNALVPGQGGLPSVLTEEWHDLGIDAMNWRHALIGNIGGKCKVLDLVESEIDPGMAIPSFQNIGDVVNRYARFQVKLADDNGKVKYVGLGKYWSMNPRQACYRGVMFRPGGPPELPNANLNLWRGWGVLAAPGDWSRLQWHVENIVCGGDPGAAEYLLNWMAYGFQHPDRQAETAVVMRGKEGSGKGVLGRGLRRIYGIHGLQISQPRHLTGNFNSHLWTCCFLFADEAFWAGDRQGEGVLKSLITEDVNMVEKKGIDQFQAKNYVKLMMASNDDWVVPVGQEARRFFVVDVDNRYAEDQCEAGVREEYFQALYEEMDGGGLAAMLWDLQRRELAGWHPRKVYKTAALTRQKRASLRGNPQWFEVLLQTGRLPEPGDVGMEPERRLPPNRVYSDVLVKWVKKHFKGCDYLNESALAVFLKEMGLSGDSVPKGGNKFRMPAGGKNGWEFPPLSDARSAWAKRYGGSWDWDEGVEDWAR